MNLMRLTIRLLSIAGVIALFFAFLQLPTLIERFQTKKSINVLALPNIIDAEYFAQFEQETGMKVHLSYFENYEELLVKMRSRSSDYDVIMASDYVQHILINEGMVKRINHKKLPFFKDLYLNLLNLDSDPGNRYSLPFSWEIYGIGIDETAFKGQKPQSSWKLLFDPTVSPARIGLIDDARELVSIAALYLFGPKKKKLTEEDLQKIKELLMAQKKRVVMYTDLRTDYILTSQAAPAVVGVSSDLYDAIRKYKNFRFLLPQEGSFMVIDTLMLPVSTQKDAEIYAFLNYLYQPHIVKKYADRYNFFPALKGVNSEKGRYLVSPTKSLFSRLRFFSYEIPEKALRELWIALKS